jgi:hypothetical protein
VAAAATVVAAVALAVFVGTNPPNPRHSAPPPDHPAATHAHASGTAVEAYRKEHAQARAELLAVIDARRDELSPEALAVIDRNMRLIDQAIADIERALAASPRDPALDRQLQYAYRQQIDLLQWAARLST